MPPSLPSTILTATDLSFSSPPPHAEPWPSCWRFHRRLPLLLDQRAHGPTTRRRLSSTRSADRALRPSSFNLAPGAEASQGPSADDPRLLSWPVRRLLSVPLSSPPPRHLCAPPPLLSRASRGCTATHPSTLQSLGLRTLLHTSQRGITTRTRTRRARARCCHLPLTRVQAPNRPRPTLCPTLPTSHHLLPRLSNPSLPRACPSSRGRRPTPARMPIRLRRRSPSARVRPCKARVSSRSSRPARTGTTPRTRWRTTPGSSRSSSSPRSRRPPGYRSVRFRCTHTTSGPSEPHSRSLSRWEDPRGMGSPPRTR